MPHLRGASGETGDRIFKFAMLMCGLAVLGMLVLIVYELVLRSGLSWHAFGFKFFAGQRLGSGEREIWRAAVHLRNAGFVVLGV